MYEGARRWASVCIQGDMLIWEVNVIKGIALTDHVPSVAGTSCTEGHMERWALCLGSCLYRARRGGTCVNQTCVYRARRAILVCTMYHIGTAQQLLSWGARL